MSKTEDSNVIIEFIQVGDSVKVSAIDPVTRIEASIVGSPKASRQELMDLAAQKLRYVLEKKDTPGS